MTERGRDLSADAKLLRVVLDNCGPLAAPEAAQEAYLAVGRAREALAELVEADLAEPVCGVCEAKEDVYALIDGDRSAPRR